MKCRIGCGACCIAPSISTAIPGMLAGKPAGIRCVQLTDDNQCKLFGLPSRPQVCIDLQPAKDLCGNNMDEAMQLISHLETLTSSHT